MRKLLVFTLAATMALFVGGAAYANYCARDYVPAATLLVPYVTVDMENGQVNPTGASTIFSIVNVSEVAQIVHLVAWDAKSKAVWDWDVLLSGYDVWTINFRDFLSGNWSEFDTAPTPLNPDDPFEWGPDGIDTYNGNAALGSLDTPDDRNIFATGYGCSPNPPYGDVSNDIIGELDGPLFARTHNGCLGRLIRSKFANDWLSTVDADPFFFYVTADVVTKCSIQFPDSDDYFNGANAVIGYDNVLIGDIIYLDAANGYSEAMGAVSIEADLDAAATLPNFYKSAFDVREPLGTAFAFRYVDDPDGSLNPGLPITTSAIVWKNHEDFFESISTNKVDDCGYYLYYAWDNDEQSNARSQGGGPSGGRVTDNDPNEFPFETQKVPIAAANFDIFEQGWFLLVFGPSQDPGVTDPTADYDPVTQAWVAVTFEFGSFSGGFEAALLGNANCFSDERLPQLNTYDGGELNNGLRGQGAAGASNPMDDD